MKKLYLCVVVSFIFFVLANIVSAQTKEAVDAATANQVVNWLKC
jgi:hypothetical protein